MTCDFAQTGCKHMCACLPALLWQGHVVYELFAPPCEACMQ